MKIQSLSVVVPNKACANKCPFCVSRMVNSDVYPNRMDINDPHYDISVSEYLKRLRYVANLGCNTVMLTGTSEPQQNKQFLATFALLHRQIGSPFANIEMQTTGLFLNGNRDYVRFLRNFVGVNTVALSVNSMDDEENNRILGHGLKDGGVRLLELCRLLKEYDFNVRLCVNLSDAFDWFEDKDRLMDSSDPERDLAMVEDFLVRCRTEYGADQLTFRKLYSSDDGSEQSRWIDDHGFGEKANRSLLKALGEYTVIGRTPYGTQIRNCVGMSTIYDEDCMGKSPTSDVMKYMILRPNCKLYSSWDTPASLVC